MKQKIIQVDAFANKPFAGNPAAVCVLPKAADETWMQNVAMEMNLSETAFLYPQNDGFNLRWFTPKVEVDLCGHATLASAHVLWEEGYLTPGTQARFTTRSGLLTVERKKDWIEMNFPAKKEERTTAPPDLLKGLGVVVPIYLGKNVFDYLVVVESEVTVRKLNPNFSLLATAPVRGIIVTAKSDSKEFDFVSRFFAPAAGVNEDPVTGSAHCCLGPFWGDRLKKNELVGYQASSRGGIVKVRLTDDRVILCGQAVTVMHGELDSF